VRRALKVLSEREVTPQLGLLKSTLLQLDSTFSEREYGANSFRDFMEKVEQAGAVSLKHAGRSMLVETVDDGGSAETTDTEPRVERTPRSGPAPRAERGARAEPAPPPRVLDVEEDEEMPSSPLGNAEGVRAVQRALAAGTPRWPMYIRQAKQFLKNSIEGFDERKYGFASVVDLLRAAAKVGVVRIERDRQGGMRVFPGNSLKVAAPQPDVESVEMESEATAESRADVNEEHITDVAAEPPILDAEIEPAEPAYAAAPAGDAEATVVAVEEPARARRARKRTAKEGGAAAGSRKTAGKGGKEPKGGKSPRPRARKSSRGKSAEAADSNA